MSSLGMAVLEGCKVINSRLEKFKVTNPLYTWAGRTNIIIITLSHFFLHMITFKMANPGGTWEDWVTAAFFAR